MIRSLILGALVALFATSATADPRTFYRGYQFRTSIDKLAGINFAFTERLVRKDFQRAPETNVYNKGQLNNTNNNLTVGAWSSVSCSGEGTYCNVDQYQEDSTQQGTINTGKKVESKQIQKNESYNDKESEYVN